MKPIRIEDLWTYRFLSAVEVSPSGRWAAFVVRRADLDENGYRSDIYVAEAAGSEVRRLTTSGKDGPFAWEPNEDALLFLSKRGGDETASSFYRIRVGGGEAEHLFDVPYKAETFCPIDDGRLVFTARVPLDENPAETEEDEGDYEVLEEIPFWQNGKGFTSRRRVRLFVLDRSSGKAEALTEPELEIGGYDVRNERIAYTARRFPGKAAATDELWIHDLSSGESQCLSRDELSLGEVRWLDADRIVTLATDMARYGRGENRELLLYELDRRTSDSLTPDWDQSVGNSVVADCRHGGGPSVRVDGANIYLVVTEHSRSKVVRIAPNEVPIDVAVPDGSVDAFAVRDGRVYTVELHPDALHELYVHDASGVRALTALNADALRDRSLSLPESFEVTCGNLALDAWIVRPTGLTPGTRVPTILTVHGGPRAAFGSVFFHEMQVLAGEGYALVYTNPRGSSGRGNEFGDLREKYGTIDYEDLMCVLDAALERYDVLDPERLGIMGGSYGGYMTNWAIGQTERFRAAASQRSIANWTSKFNTTDIGYVFNRDAIGTTPWDTGGADKLWWHSPLRCADKVSTPTLFIHSEEDYRCWLAEGLQMFTALRYHGVDSRLVLFRGENHELSRSGKPTHRARRLREILDWFDRYLKRS